MFRMLKSWLTSEHASRPQPKPQLSLTTLESREVPAALNAWPTGLRLVGPEVTSQPVAVKASPVVARPFVAATGAVTVKVTSQVAADAVSVKVTSPVAITPIPQEAAARAAFAAAAKAAVTGLTQPTSLNAALDRIAATGVDTRGHTPGGASRLRLDQIQGVGGTLNVRAKAHNLVAGFGPRQATGSSTAHTQQGGLRVELSPKDAWASDGPDDLWQSTIDWTIEGFGMLLADAERQAILTGGTDAALEGPLLRGLGRVLGGAGFVLDHLVFVDKVHSDARPTNAVDSNGDRKDDSTANTSIDTDGDGVMDSSSDPYVDANKDGVVDKPPRDGGAKTMPDQNKLQVRPLTDEEFAKRERFRRSLTTNPGPGDNDTSAPDAVRSGSARILTKLDLYGRPNPDAVAHRPMTAAEFQAAIAFQKGTYSTPQGGDNPAGVGHSGEVDSAYLGLMEAEQQQGVREARDEAAKRISG